MYDIGIPEFIILFVVFVGIGLVTRQKGGVRVAGPTLVLRKFSLNEDASDHYHIEIIGRASGLTAWLLTVMRFDTETSLKVSDKDIAFRSSSLFGQIHQAAPLPCVSSTHCGYSRPFGYLILGAIFILVGLYSYLAVRPDNPGADLFPVIGLTIGLLFFIMYWLSKKMALSIQTKGGIIIGLIFKRSVIENVPIDIQKSLQAINIINENVLESQKLKI